jgi:hypothetical protein
LEVTDVTRAAKFALSFVLATVALIATQASSPWQVNIGISVGTPPPPPPVVIVPGPPAYSTPAYYYGGRYYGYYDGAWFISEGHEGPWVLVPVERVPERVLALPRAYERMPPGHLKKIGPHPWAHTARGHDREDDRGREREGRGHEDRDR